MATSLAISGIRAGFGWSAAQTTTVGADTTNSGSFNFSSSLANGTGEGKCSVFYVDEISIAAGATANLDLSGALTDVFGASIAFTKIRLMYIELISSTLSTGSSIYVGGHATAAFSSFFGDATDKIRIRLGGCMQLSCSDSTGYPVTLTTADMLKIQNNDGSNPVIVRVGFAGE